MSKKSPSHTKSPSSKRSLDSTTISEFSSSVRSDQATSRPLSPAQKRFNSRKDKREMKEIDISLSNDLNDYQKNVSKLDRHTINGKTKSRKYVLRKKERMYPERVDDKHYQENKMPREYNEHSILNVNANSVPQLSSGSLESSATANIQKEETHSKIRLITVSEALKTERTSTPVSPKKEDDYFADTIGKVHTVFYETETKKLDFVSLTNVESNVTHEDSKQEGNEQEGEISDMKDANQNVEETTSSHPEIIQNTDEAQEIMKSPKTLRYAEMLQRNTSVMDKSFIKNEKSDIVTSTNTDATGLEQRETKSNFDGFAEINVTNTKEKEKTPMNKYELLNSFSDAKEQQQENVSFKERVVRDVDEIKEAKQETDATIEKNNGKDDEKIVEEEYNYRKDSQDNLSEKLTEDDNHAVELLGAEDNIPSKHCANETSNWSQTLKHELRISDTEQNETVTEQHISSGLRENSLSSLADPELHGLRLSNDDTDKTDLTTTEGNSRSSSDTEQVKVLTTVTSSVVDSSEDVYSDSSSSEDDASDVTGGQTENIGNIRGGKPDENAPVEEPRIHNAENVTSIQPENEQVKIDVGNKKMDDIIHEPETDDTNDGDVTMETEYHTAVESVQFKHNVLEKCEKELPLEQKPDLEPHSINNSETRQSPKTEDQTAAGELLKETGTDATVGVLQDADEEPNIMNVKKLEKKEWQEERSEELVEEIAEEGSLGLESGTFSEKDAVYSETQANINLQDETDEPLTMEEETIAWNLESELTVSTHAVTDVETKPHSIKDSETSKSPETEDQTSEMELPKETGTGVEFGVLQDQDETSIMNVNKLEKKEWQEERSEELVAEIAEKRSLGLESGNVSDKDAVYSKNEANINLQDETNEPFRKEKETIKLNLESELTVSTHAETDAETKSMDSTEISSIGAERRIGTPESTDQNPDTNEEQYGKSKEIKAPSVSEEHERTAVKENGEHNETLKLLDEENIIAVKIEESPTVMESEMVRDSRSDKETPECIQNDNDSYEKPESLNFDNTISITTEDSNAEGTGHSTTHDGMEKDHFRIGLQSDDQINTVSSGISQTVVKDISQTMVKDIDLNHGEISILGEPQNHQAVLKDAEIKISESIIKGEHSEDSTIEQELQDPKEQHETNVVETAPNEMDATKNL